MKDKLVAVVSHMGFLLMFMESGRIYKMNMSEYSFEITFSFIAEVPQP